MPSQLSLGLFARLCAHYPGLGGDDAAADERARSWCAVIDRSDPRVATEACRRIVEGWSENRYPRIADWQDTARTVALQILTSERPELEAANVDPAGLERLHELVSPLKEKLTLQAAKKMTLKPEPKEPRPVDPNHRLPTYDELYGEKENACEPTPTV